MLKFVAVVQRKKNVDFEEFRRLWCEEHPQLVLKMPGVRRYQQNLAYQGGSRDWGIDGIAEVWFDDHDAMRAAFASPEGAAANDHQELFAGEVRWFLAEEIPYDKVV